MKEMSGDKSKNNGRLTGAEQTFFRGIYYCVKEIGRVIGINRLCITTEEIKNAEIKNG
jgi:hypothetical protein